MVMVWRRGVLQGDVMVRYSHDPRSHATVKYGDVPWWCCIVSFGDGKVTRRWIWHGNGKAFVIIFAPDIEN